MGARASRVVVCLLLCATWLGGVPGRVWAQAGWYVTPSFGLMEEYDDNVFVSSSDRRSDFITRFTPGLEAGYVSEPLTALVRGAFDSEVYADHSELNDAFASYRTGLTLGYLPLRTLSFGLDATYAETNDVTELLVATTGFQEERRNATELVVAPSAAWNITARDVARGSYSFTRDTADESPDILAHRGRLTLSRDVTPLDTGLVGYIVRVFENEDGPTTTSHVPLLGWRRQFTRQTSATVEGGPRFTDGGVQPEVSARLEHDFRRARVTLAYERTEAVIIGGSGVVEAAGRGRLRAHPGAEDRDRAELHPDLRGRGPDRADLRARRHRPVPAHPVARRPGRRPVRLPGAGRGRPPPEHRVGGARPGLSHPPPGLSRPAFTRRRRPASTAPARARGRPG
jgi:hypothetical protein